MAIKKLTQKQKDYFINAGYLQEDLTQLRLAMCAKYTTIKLNNEKITHQKAIQLIGEEVYLSGIGRSAFHSSSSRITDDGTIIIYFNSFL